MDLQQLRAIITIAETGSVTKAAELCNIVQPALSRKVRLLEQELGKRIFERSHTGMRLTEDGHQLVQAARRALFTLDQAVAEIRQKEDAIGGLVTVGLLPSTCDLLAGELVNAVKSQFPNVHLRLHTGYAGQLQLQVERGDLDIALMYNGREAPAVEVRPLADEPLFLVGPRGPDMEWGDHEPITTLARLPLILPTNSHSVRGIIEQACSAPKIPLNIVAEVDDIPLTKALLAAGVGYTVLAGIAVAEDLLKNSLMAVPLGKPPLQRRVCLTMASGPRLSEPTACVAELFEELIKAFVRRGRWPGARLVDFE